MLQFLRKTVTSWLGILILALVLGAMVITLFQRQSPGGGGTVGTGPVLAKVGDLSIAESEYLRMVDRAVQQERQRTPEMTNAQFVSAGGGEMVLNQMVANKAMRAFADNNRMAVSKRMVDGEIASIPALQVNGKFDDATFRRLLAEQRMTEQELRDNIASDLLRRQLLQPVVTGSAVPRGMAEPFAALLLEVRKGAILPIPSVAMPDPGKPTDQQLTAFHQEHRANYTLPERRAFRFAEISGEGLAAAARPTEADIRKYYDAHQGDYGGLEQRDVSAILLRDEAAARAFVAEVRGGKSFADAASAHGFSAADVALGAQTKPNLTTEVNEQVANAAFATAAGAVSDPVQSPLGWHVVQVTKVTPATPRPFATVSAEIEKKLLEQKAQDLLSDTVAKAEDRLAAGESLGDVAKSLNIPVQTAPALTADGRLFDEQYQVTRVNQPLLPKVFAADTSEGPQVVEVGPGHFALIEVTDVTAPVLVPLDKIRADVELAWQIKTRSDAAKKAADTIAAAVSKGESLAAAAKAATGGAALPPAQPLAVRRLELTQLAQQGQQVPPPVLLMLNTPKGQARVLPAPGGQGWFVVKVDDVTPGDLSQAPQLADAVRQGLVRDAGTELAETYVRSIERSVGVVRQPEQLKAVNRRLTGSTVE